MIEGLIFLILVGHMIWGYEKRLSVADDYFKDLQKCIDEEG